MPGCVWRSRRRAGWRAHRADSARERERFGIGGGSGSQAPALTASLQMPTAAQVSHSRICKICWEPGSDGDPLLEGTCSCSGSMAYVHGRCLLNWQRHAADPSQCSTCRSDLQLPSGLASSVRLPPLWQERLQQQLAEAQQQGTAMMAFRLWNWGAVACGMAHALLHAPQAWLGAPAAACRLQQQAPLLHRWQLLAQCGCAAVYAACWTPLAGAVQARWLAHHALSFVLGLLLEGCTTAAAVQAPALRPLAVLLRSASLVLQAAGLQHLQPFLAAVRGYQAGINQAFRWTTRALLFLPTLLGMGRGGGGPAQAGATAAQLLPILMHAAFRAMK